MTPLADGPQLAGPLPDGTLLPRAHYALVAEGTRKDKPNDPIKSDPLTEVSIVEVTAIRFEQVP